MKALKHSELKTLLDDKVEEYNTPRFIEHDPVIIPHSFQKKQDIEITAFWAAILAWGQRKTIINKCFELFDLMGNTPHDFILNHSESDLKSLESFKHRTFNYTDTLYFIEFLKWFYSAHDSLEEAFFVESEEEPMEAGLIKFHRMFFSLSDSPQRTRKHISTPLRKSACKRLNMFLRWMVRKDDKGVDFGIWKKIDQSDLFCPCDVHVEKIARRFQMISRKQLDWQAVKELTCYLRELDPKDPVKYDFALFGLGLEEKL
ncbi:MAG: TIGR02757 family protein [Bacteroidota bacterium]